ncbi:erythromycin esterase family protein [Aggregatilinea lenta]|uniref:erythromycin esterase family protein n=1 Tax=Aggregatilinea lenta TaxID=913108 RepID=UPI000E5AF638|nr:erythromycin esterase family protein [Aggregatilinea lenta]
MRMWYKARLGLLVLALVGLPAMVARGQGPDETVDPAITAWLQANAIPFDTAEPGGSDADLMPIREIVGDARIVALGEATHGTHEFFAMKHRLIEFLIEEMGFTVFAMEANWLPMERINDYVQTGDGDPVELLAAQGFWVWNTQEVLDLIEWLRAFNVAHPDNPVQVTGFDAQDPLNPQEAVLAYLREVDPDAAALAEERYTCLPEIPQAFTSPQEFDAYLESMPSCTVDTEAVHNDIVQFRAGYEPTLGTDAYERALHSADLVVQAYRIFAPGSTLSTRDRYMAENVEWLIERNPDAKIILWAHNYHVFRSPDIYGRTMAGRLEENHGDEMVVFGFTFYQGVANSRKLSMVDDQVVWGSIEAFELPPAIAGSYEAAFHSTGLPRFILSFKGLELSGDARWLRNVHLMRQFGAGYYPDNAENYFGKTTLPIIFDAVIYFDDTTASQLIPMPGVEYAN